MKQSEWISYEQILPLQFDQTLNFVERKAVNGELWLEEAEEACRVQLEILLENGALTAGYYWPAALELQSGLLAEEQPVWQLILKEIADYVRRQLSEEIWEEEQRFWKSKWMR